MKPILDTCRPRPEVVSTKLKLLGHDELGVDPAPPPPTRDFGGE